MSWVRLDDHFPDHPKWLSMGPFWRVLGTHLHVTALCWCNRHLTDGKIPAGALERLMPELICIAMRTGDAVDVNDVAKALVDAGIWESIDGGYAIHDYLHYQPSRASIEDKRKLVSSVRKQAGGRGGITRALGYDKQTPSKTEANDKQTPNKTEANDKQTPSKTEANDKQNHSPVPNPNPKEDTNVSSRAREENVRKQEATKLVNEGEKIIDSIDTLWQTWRRLMPSTPLSATPKEYQALAELAATMAETGDGPARFSAVATLFVTSPSLQAFRQLGMLRAKWAELCAWLDEHPGVPFGDLRTLKQAQEPPSWIDTIPSVEETRKLIARGLANVEANKRDAAERAARGEAPLSFRQIVEADKRARATAGGPQQ